MLELGGNVISPHARLNLNLELLNDNTDLGDVLLGLSEVVDALWRLLDPFNDLIELCTKIIVLVKGFLCNQLDFLINDLLIFSAVIIPDIFAVDGED